ncbi:hypothetical protein ACI3ET_01180 [Ornithinimicrobium sp. LYQ121]|uniref:hypothetical protein n=1 Tax=Ornithinimicrobium sp. LYQ121 TaxID=3378801 RepID=UPI0038529026
MRIGPPSLVLASVMALTSCSGADPQERSSTGAAEAATHTVTVTATETVTATVTATKTATPTETVTATETITATTTVTATAQADPAVEQASPSPSPSAPRPTSPPRSTSTVGDFDVDWAHVCAERILRDIETVDERIVDGGAVGSGLGLLASSYGCLADRGAPPGVDAGDYLPRLATLQDFATRAANTYLDDPMEASATYSVVRQETAPVLQMLNEATGSAYALP